MSLPGKWGAVNGCNLRHSPFLSGGGGQNLTLPPMVTNLAASTGDQTITLTWTNPVSDVLSGVLVVYNANHIPEKVSDGTKVDAGLSETASLTGLENGTLYYIRVFPYNAKKQYQTLPPLALPPAPPCPVRFWVVILPSSPSSPGFAVATLPL